MTRLAHPLRLLAQDADDLQILSAALQDAVAKVGDIRFDPADRTLTVALNRFRWEAEGEVRHERVRAALQIGSALSVQARKIRREPKDAVLELLAIAFEPGVPPGGAVMLTFAGGGDLRVEVECLDVALADVSAPWPSRHAPRHDAAEG
jgi:hypothetical protein